MTALNDSLIPIWQKLIIDIYSQKADFVVMIIDFDAKSCNWSINDNHNFRVSQLDSSSSLYGMKRHISEPTHVLQYFYVCIDLIFNNQRIIVMDSGVHVS